MKVCYISCYRDGTGYAHAALGYLKALEAAGVDVVARPVKMTQGSYPVDESIQKLEEKDVQDVTHVIQHNLPSEFSYKEGVENIGMFAYETDTLPSTMWLENIKLMDKVIVFAQFQKDAILKADKNFDANKIYVLPHALDTEKFKRQPDSDLRARMGINEDTCIFYTISDNGVRKNIDATIRAYLEAFSSEDNVLLLLKLKGVSQSVLKSHIEDIKRLSGKYKNLDRYPKIVIITKRLTDKQIDELHIVGDVFVSSSYGEAFCIPFSEAGCFGNARIISGNTAFLDYTDATEPVVKTKLIPCFGSQIQPQKLYSCNENWWECDPIDLSKHMTVYAKALLDPSDEMKKTLASRSIRNRHRFSYETVGHQLKDILNAKTA